MLSLTCDLLKLVGDVRLAIGHTFSIPFRPIDILRWTASGRVDVTGARLGLHFSAVQNMNAGSTSVSSAV